MRVDERIRILCVDDHAIVREGLTLILERQPDMKVVGVAATAQEAVRVFQTHRPDITLMDLQLEHTSGVDAIRQIRRIDPEARIIVLTIFQGDEDVFRALQSGATTYLLKDTISDDLIRVVREVHAGACPRGSQVEALLADRAGRPALTAREVQVMELVAVGLRNREIATSLHISEETVGVHIRNIFAKLDVNDRSAAIAISLRRGIIHLQ
jgi:DNA-binding NarL/FixJ family response regulator